MAPRGGRKLKALVTGGSGFLGAHLVQQLVDSGRYDVRVFDVRDSGASPVPVVVGDLRKPESVASAVAGCDVVFHCATAAPTGANALNNELMRSVNVDGTRHVIQACVQHGVPKLVRRHACSQHAACTQPPACRTHVHVRARPAAAAQVYTSSASVVFEGKHLHNVDEAQPYAKKPMDYYTHTKAGAARHARCARATPCSLCRTSQRPRHPHHAAHPRPRRSWASSWCWRPTARAGC